MSIQGKNICFTGRISKPRNEFVKFIESQGAHWTPDVTKSTDYLVVGDKPGSKLAKAAQLNILTITERQLLDLTREEPQPLDEEPLTQEGLEELLSHLIELECRWCGRAYKQWDTLPNFETCPVCSILSHPTCPHCSDNPIYVTDFLLYRCMTCGTWFPGPYPNNPYVRTTRHIHMWCFPIRTKDSKVKKKCPCGQEIILTEGEIEQAARKHQRAPELVKKWRQEEEQRRRKREQEQKAREYLESLTENQIEQLRRQLWKD